ncbi:MAG: hypothetical protein WAL95_22880 [Candidatus Acidiferrales bacterium]
MKTIKPPLLELCSAEYTATLVQVPDGNPQIWILAKGEHPTSGYEVTFHQAPLDVYPPEFSLWHLKPAGRSLDVITPFAKFTSFDARGKVEKVTVVDAGGRNAVPVKPIKSTSNHK